jgi:predicted GNAT superfamily acetyltransferase
MTFSIRPLETIAEFQACETLQRCVWAMPDNLEVVPMHLLLSVQKNSGLMLGAFDDRELVGFVFGLPACTSEGKPKHYSHMLGVAPGYQGAGIGHQLKLAQREFALDQGIDLITWTYDPLESLNAHLNIHKLGAVCQTYVRNYYGALTDGLNVGIPTDRFEIEWWIASDWVKRRLSGERGLPDDDRVVQVNATTQTPSEFLAPGAFVANTEAPAVRVEIPPSYQSIKSADAELALDWREAMRRVFETYFAAGYRVVDFLSEWVEGERRSFYILQRLGQHGDRL